ncbi:MAG: homocysteine S-methyltransferase family protein [Clostridia bacterium]|nr:homocysteine S-methyltransferase family protein [Clostridia bacterium]
MDLKSYITSHFLVLDGGMGTMLMQAGMPAGSLPELMNLTHPEIVTAVHKKYVDAGTDMVITCTFGANEKKMAGCGHEIEAVITAAVANARASGAKYVALDIGPIGQLLVPSGTLQFEEAYAIFARQIRCGVSCGVDAIYMETMSDLLEVKAAVLAARDLCDLPIFATLTYESSGRTFLGVSPECAALTLQGLGIHAIGINCSLGPKEILPIAKRLAAVTSIPMIIKPNAGLPDMSSGTAVYDITPEDFATYAKAYLDLGFSIFGGCCGTNPDYIHSICGILQNYTVPQPEQRHISALCSGTKYFEVTEDLVFGERVNPSDNEDLLEALEDEDIETVVDLGMEQSDDGAQVIYVNISTPEVEEADMLPSIVREMQGVIDLPLQLDSRNPEALEAALRCYNGTPLVGSICSDEKSLTTLLPIAAKYGAMIVGTPAEGEDSLAAAEKIVRAAAEYGMTPERILMHHIPEDQQTAVLALGVKLYPQG